MTTADNPVSTSEGQSGEREVLWVNAKKGTKGFVSTPLDKRYWCKVDRRGDDECWPWIGSTNQHGRGQIWVDGRKRPAPQVAWSLSNGAPFPEHLDACHSCDNPNCVNPAHIWPGTARDNALDAVRKGRVISPFHRGVPPHNLSKTHCPAGHEYTVENTIHPKRGGRACRACQQQWNRATAKRRWEKNKSLRREADAEIAHLRALLSRCLNEALTMPRDEWEVFVAETRAALSPIKASDADRREVKT